MLVRGDGNSEEVGTTECCVLWRRVLKRWAEMVKVDAERSELP